MVNNFLGRTTWGTPLPISPNVRDLYGSRIKQVTEIARFAEKRIDTTVEPTVLDITLLSYILAHSVHLNILIAQDGIALSELAFLAARYPDAWSLVPFTNHSMNIGYYQSMNKEIRLNSSGDDVTAWALTLSHLRLNIIPAIHLVEQIRELDLDFDHAIPYVNAGVIDGEAIRHAIRNNIDPVLMSSAVYN